MTSSRAPLRLGVLISGTGRTLQNFLQERAAGRLDVDVCCVVSSREDAGGIGFAREADVPVHVLEPRRFASPDDYGRAIARPLRDTGVELVAMAGFLHLWKIENDLVGRVINIHPALLPAFGGKGFYGDRVHRAVLAAGVKLSGCTVHFADDQYDHGPIILQRTVPVDFADTADTLARRVFDEECRAYPEAVRLFAADRLRLHGTRVEVLEAP